MAVQGYNSLYFATGLDNTGLKQGVHEALNIVSSMGSAITALNPFAIFGAGAVAAFGAISSSAFKMARNFEHAMKEVETISAATQNNFEGISKEVFELSKISPDSPVELAQAYYQIVSAGYDGAKGLKLLEVSAKGAVAGVTSTKVAADGITTALNAFKIAAEDSDKVADQFFTTVKLGKTTFEELSSSLNIVAPLAAATGFSLEEVLAAVASLTKQGVPTNKAMTQIRSGIEAMTEVLGDGVAETMTLQGAFQLLYDKAGGSQKALKEMLGRMEAVQAVLGTTGAQAEGAASDLAELGNSAGATEKAFASMATSNKNQWAVLGNTIDTYTRTLGDNMLSLSNSLAGWLNSALGGMDNLTAKYVDQKAELYELERALGDVEEGSKEWLGVKNQLLDIADNFIDDIDRERITTEGLLEIIHQVNDAYLVRYKLASRQQDLEKEKQKEAKLSLYSDDLEQKYNETIDRLRARAEADGVTLYLDLDASTEDIINQIEESFKMAGKAGEKGLDISLFSQGYARDAMHDLEVYQNLINSTTGALGNQKKEVERLTSETQRLNKETLNTAQGQKLAIDNINKAMRESEMLSYFDSGNKAIDEALQNRLDIISQFREIDSTQKIESLKPFLDSELEEVRKYAEKRYRIINRDFDGQPDGGGDAKFADMLKKREEEYKEYEAWKNQVGKEAADERFKQLLKEGRDYGFYLQNLLDQTDDFAKKRAIILEAETKGFILNQNREEQKNVSTLKPEPIVLDVEIDTTSINYMKRKIEELQEAFDKAPDDVREMIRPQLEMWQSRLDIARNGVQEEKDLYADVTRTLQDMNRSQLRDYIAYWKERLETAKVNAGKEKDPAKKNSYLNEIKMAEDRIKSAENEMVNNTAEGLRAVSGTLNGAASMFRKFGNDTLADALEKMSGIANSMATILTGVASGDWLSVASGVIGAITTLFGGGSKKNEKTRFEKTIERLEGNIALLGAEIEKAFGYEVIKRSREQLDQYRLKVIELNKQLEHMKELQSSHNAFDIVEFLQLGGEQGLLDLQTEIAQLESEFAGAIDTLNERLTGTTSDSITDSIIQGFKDGKKGIEDFAQTFEDMMRETMYSIFKNNFLNQRIQEFYEQLAEAAGTPDDHQRLNSFEILQLQGQFNDIIRDAQSEFELLNQLLESAGLQTLDKPLTQDQKPGLTGAIQGVTEDTANILEGYINAMRIDLRQSLNASLQALQYLSQIADNTYSSSETLKSIDGRFRTIENAIHNFNAQG